MLCGAGRGDWLLCQITSNPHGDPDAVKITPANLSVGALSSLSFARPNKLFTANEKLMIKRVAVLDDPTFSEILLIVINRLQGVMPQKPEAPDVLPTGQDKDS